MKRRHIIIIAVLAVLAVAAAIVAGLGAINSIVPKTTNAIQTQIDEAFDSADYFVEAQVQTYTGSDPEAQADKDAVADSASVSISTKTLTAANFTDFLTRLPTTDLNTFYQVTVEQTEDGDYTSVYGFNQKELQDDAVTASIVKALEARESIETTYYQITSNGIPDADENSVTVTALSPVNDVENARKIADAVISENVNIIVINSPLPDAASYVQNAGVFGQMDDFDNGVDFGLQFADAAFTATNQISVIVLAKEVQISYGALDDGQTLESLTQIANDINTGSALGLDVTVNDPTAPPE